MVSIKEFVEPEKKDVRKILQKLKVNIIESRWLSG